MAFANRDYGVDQATTWTESLDLWDSAGAAVSLQGASAEMMVRARAKDTGTPLVDLTVANGGIVISGNRISLTASSTQTNLLPGAYDFEVKVTYASGVVDSILKGKWRVSAGTVHTP